MKIVNLISVEQPTVVSSMTGNIMSFFLDTVEKFNIEDGDVVIARGHNELFMGIARYRNYAGDYWNWNLVDVTTSYYYCNL